MTNRLTHIRKFQLALGGIALLSILAYHQSIKGTIALVSETEALRGTVKQKDELQYELAQLKTEESRLNQLLGDTDIDVHSIKQELLRETIEYCETHDLQIQQLPESNEFEENHYKIVSNSLIVSGDFKELVQLNHHFEQDMDLSRLSSVHYYVERDKKTRKQRLYARYVLQNITNS